MCLSVREREGVCVHTYKSSSLRGAIQDILSPSFASDIFIYVPLMGTAEGKMQIFLLSVLPSVADWSLNAAWIEFRVDLIPLPGGGFCPAFPK